MKWYEWAGLGAAAVGFGYAATRRKKKKPPVDGPEPWDDQAVLEPGAMAFAEVGAEIWVRLPPGSWQVETVDTMSGVECVVVADMQVRPMAVYVLLRPVMAACKTVVRFTNATGQQLKVTVDTGYVPG